MPEASNKQWKGSLDGTPWMHRALIVLTHYLPLSLMYGLMALSIPFYVVLDSRGRRASYAFFRQRMGYGRFRSFLHVFRNMYNMGKVVIDRFAAYAGKQFRVEGNPRWLQEALSQDGRHMLFSSHLGNFELSGYMDFSPRPIKVLVYAGENELIMQHRSRLFSNGRVEMVPIREDMSHLFILNDALQNGEVVSLAGDRIFDSSKTVRCRFFGEEASFPAGPFTLAVKKDAASYALFVVKESVKSFRILAEELKADGEGPAKVRSLAQSYASALEKVARKYPDQWFNFYDFWA